MEKKTGAVLIAGVLMGATAGYGALISEDFETGQTVGNKPTGASVVRPSTSTADAYVHVVDSASNPAGTGNGVEIRDTGAASGEGIILTYNFVADAASQLSAVRVDFSLAALSSAGAGDDYIGVAFGEYNAGLSFSSSGRRFTDMRLYNDGTVDFRGDSGSNTGTDISTGSHDISIFVNDALSTVDYIGLDATTYTLAANSVAYWLDGSMIMFGAAESTTMDLGDVTAGGFVGTTEDNLGKFGFETTTADVGLNYVIDDIEISAIPEPATLGMFGLVSGAMLFIRRFKM